MDQPKKPSANLVTSDTTGGATSPAESENLGRVPDTIGNYKIISVLGAGGMGVVYEAEQQQPKRRVALKLIRSNFVTRALLKRFEREVEVLGRLEHPGIARVYEAGTADAG